MGYISKEEVKIPIQDPSGKWSDLTLLPEWEEKYCNVYTAKKHGKWVMLKALKKEYADNPEFRQRLEKEFETRYNLSHPNIVMVNDFEVVPGVGGYAIITDDAYGYSLRRLIDERRLTPKIVSRLQSQLLYAMEYIEENHILHPPITPDTIIFTEYNENLKLINVGYDYNDAISKQDAIEDVKAYGKILTEVLDHLPTSIPKLRRVANKCIAEHPGYHSITDVHLDIERRISSQIYIFLCVIIVILLAVLAFFAFFR